MRSLVSTKGNQADANYFQTLRCSNGSDAGDARLRHGGAACAAWYKDYLAFIAQQQISAPKVTLGKVRHLDVDGGNAYLVVPTVLTYDKSGKPVKDGGVVTLSLKKTRAAWVITGWAWADY